MSYPSWPTRVLRVFGALALVCAAGWYSPLFTAAIWHVFHPSGWVEYRGLRVRVPWPWTADTDAEGEDFAMAPQGLALRKTPFIVNRRSEGESIFVTAISADPGVSAEEQTEAWMRTFRRTHPGSSLDGKPPTAALPNANCARAQSDAAPGQIVWTCISLRGGWVADFAGCLRDEPVFFDIVSRLKR